MDLTCKQHEIHVMLALTVSAHILSVFTAPIYVRVFGMKRCLVTMTLVQALCCSILLFSTSIELTSVLMTLIGLTGGRQAFSYLYIAE